MFFSDAQRFSFRIFHPTKNLRCFFCGFYRSTCHESLEVNAPRLRGEVWKLSWRTSYFFVGGWETRRKNAWRCVFTYGMISIYVCWYIILSTCIIIYTCTYIYIYIYIYIYMYVWKYMYIRMMYICLHIYLRKFFSHFDVRIFSNGWLNHQIGPRKGWFSPSLGGIQDPFMSWAGAIPRFRSSTSYIEDFTI